MKFSIFGILPAVLIFASCESMNAPLNTDGTFDPLRIPGSGIKSTPTKIDSEFSPGQFVTASIPNTAFFNKRPKGSEDADKLLTANTNMKIISNDASYVKVELDSGEIGWVPSVMISTPSVNEAPIDGAYQVFPPLPAGTEDVLPLVDPTGEFPAITDPAAVTPAIADPAALTPAITDPAAVTPAIADPAAVTPPIVEPNQTITPLKAGQKAQEQVQKLSPPPSQ